MTRRPTLLACAMLLAPASLVAQSGAFDAPPPPPAPCLSEADMRAVATWLVPDAIEGLSRRCRPMLDRGAFLSDSGPALAQRYRREDGTAADAGRQALSKVTGDSAVSLLGGGFAGELIVEGALDMLKPSDCATADRMAALLSPLPRSSLGELAAILVAMGIREGAGNGKPLPVRLCKAGAR